MKGLIFDNPLQTDNCYETFIQSIYHGLFTTASTGASELLEHIEEMFPRYYMCSDMLSVGSSLHWSVNITRQSTHCRVVLQT